MSSTRVLACGLALFLISLPLPSPASSSQQSAAPTEAPHIAEFGSNVTINSSQQKLSGASTLYWNIYGGEHPGGLNDRRPEGEFNTLELMPTLQGWTPVDLTEHTPLWHVSEFNAANLDAIAQNHAMFCGAEAGESGYSTAPGYANDMDDLLDWSAPTNPVVSANVRITFDYNMDLEPNSDFFVVEYDSAGVLKTLATFTGDTRDNQGNFTTPAHFDQTIFFTPLMYSNYQVHLRLRVQTDSSGSDADGLYPSDGAVQVDNIRVYFNGNLVTAHGDGVATFEDLGGGAYDTEGWAASPSHFVGNFGRVWPLFFDIDPCSTDNSAQIAFIDDGTPPLNSTESTGGSVSGTWAYGTSGGFVVNYQGGLDPTAGTLMNEFWSPEIAWDDSNTSYDDGIEGGAILQFTVWQHLPLNNGIFWTWRIRSYPDENGNWSPWRDRGFVYYGQNPLYVTITNDVTDLLVDYPEKVQIALGVKDLAQYFSLPGGDATPSPLFDNVSFWKYEGTGPQFSSNEVDLFQDSFPNSGTSNWQGDAANASVRIDAAKDINLNGTANVAGDSLVMTIKAVNPGSSLVGPGSNGLPVMRWALEANPAFDSVRVLPAGATMSGISSRGFPVWTGTVEGDSARTEFGDAVDDLFFFDAPNDGPAVAPYQSDEDAMFFPGDLFRWFIEAEDSFGETSTMPADTTGFLSGSGYSRLATVRALPSVVPDGFGGLKQPSILLINDFGRRGEESPILSAQTKQAVVGEIDDENSLTIKDFGPRGGESEFLYAMAQNGMVEGRDYDTYTVVGPSSLVGNGIGSAGVHGATGSQLSGYHTILYMAGNLSSGLICDGSNQSGNDKSNDLATLENWHHLAGDRYIAYFADNIASSMSSQGSTTLSYLQNTMGVEYVTNDANSALNGQVTPYVQPSGSPASTFVTGVVANGGCPSINKFDYIQPYNGTGAVVSHNFTDGGAGGPVLPPAAGIWYERNEFVGIDSYRRVDLTFPFGFNYVVDTFAKSSTGVSDRSVFLAEVLNAFGENVYPGAATQAGEPGIRRLLVEQNHPNPFNPSTTIRFTAPSRGEVGVKIYNLKGQLVRTLFQQVVEGGVVTSVRWNGKDDLGSAVSSGVYLYQVKGLGFSETRKMALVR